MKTILMLTVGLMLPAAINGKPYPQSRSGGTICVIWWRILRWTRYALALDD